MFLFDFFEKVLNLTFHYTCFCLRIKELNRRQKDSQLLKIVVLSERVLLSSLLAEEKFRELPDWVCVGGTVAVLEAVDRLEG